MTPPRWEYGRKTAEGVPVWYVTIDESGHPYYDEADSRPFAMGAILSGDPRNAVRSLQSTLGKKTPSKYTVATGEIKHTHSDQGTDAKIMDQLEKQGYVLFATSTKIMNQTDQSIENGSAIYVGTLSRLLVKIANCGPEGIYRIRIDESDYLDEALLKICAEAAFSEPGRTHLADRSPVRLYDSAFDPAIQLADSFVGQYRNALGRNQGNEFADRHRIFVANRKKSSPGRAVSLLSKTGRQDSCAMGIRVGDSTSLLSPYSDDTRVLDTHLHVPYKNIRPRTGRNPEKSGFYSRFRGQDKAKTTAKTTRRNRK